MDSSKQKAQVIPSRGELKRKAVNFKKGVDLKFSDEIKAKLDQAIESSKDEFVNEVLETLRTLRESFAAAEANDASRSAYVREVEDAAFSIKGMGGLFNFPLLTEFAKSLNDFVREVDPDGAMQMELISIHLDTLYVVLNNKITGSGGALEQQLRDSLRAAITKIKSKAKAKSSEAPSEGGAAAS